MDITASVDIPCIELPKISEIPSVSLLGGAEMRAVMDFAAGVPTDCKLTFNLLLQLGPLFGSLACLIKILNVIASIEGLVNALKPPTFPGLPDAIPKVLDAIAQLKKCIPIPGIDLCSMVKSILMLILNFLSCLIDEMESILKFQATLDFDGAADNPALHDALICAQNSSQAALENTMGSIGGLQPIFTVVTILIGIAQVPFQLPDFSKFSVTPGAPLLPMVESLKSTVDGMKEAVSMLPC